MEIAVLLSLAAAILTIAKIIHSRKLRIENRRLRDADTRNEIITLLSNFIDLHAELEKKFTKVYLKSLKKKIDEVQFAAILDELNYMREQREWVEVDRKLISGLDEEEVDNTAHDLAKIHRHWALTEYKARILLTARVIGGRFKPVDEELSIMLQRDAL